MAVQGLGQDLLIALVPRVKDPFLFVLVHTLKSIPSDQLCLGQYRLTFTDCTEAYWRATDAQRILYLIR